MDTRLRLVLLGKQGAGKGTQAQRLAAHYGVEHLSTGDMFRAQIKKGTPFGLEAQPYMDRGDLVPDSVVIGVVTECLEPDGPLADGFVLDGFPRTLPQARELERVLGARPLHVAINLDVPRDVVLHRLAGRRVCETCGAIYHVDNPPKSNWTCDVDGGRVVQRSDDTEAAIEQRLAEYEEKTLPIIDFYRAQGRLVVVDGVGDGDEVFARLAAAVDERLTPLDA